MERNYDFRARHWQVHLPRRNAARTVQSGEILIDSSWSVGGCGGTVTEKALADFRDYFWVSMNESVSMTDTPGSKTIWFSMDESLEKGFVLDVEADQVSIRLAKDSEAFRAVVYLEDCMNLEGAPVLSMGQTVRKPLYDYRVVHSGTGIDEFPDSELLALVHAGYDSIVIFIKDFDRTAAGPCNIKDIMTRAKQFGLASFLYNYMPSYVHPSESRAQEVFDSIYGEMIRRYPDTVGLMLYGESLEFPSKDPHTTGKKHNESVIDGIPDTRPSPGWYPCEDYPAYLAGIKNAVHKVNPNVKVIFSTYNWAYQPKDRREEFLARLDDGFDISVCYELTLARTLEGLRTPVMDYSISADTPSDYFKEESTACKKRGFPVMGNVNTTGIAWDFGCVPYVPAPYKLLNRLRTLRWAHGELGVTSHYACHHMGWWDCVCSDLGKWASWEDFEPDYEELLGKIARRDYGEKAEAVMAVWKIWSEAMNYYIASNEDQYGPWRVGAAYPFIFQPNITRTFAPKKIQFPAHPNAHHGGKIVETLYQPFENTDQAPAFLRHPAELRSLLRMKELWKEGLDLLADPQTEEGQRLQALGQFIFCQIQTTIHIKKWWLANMRLQIAADTTEALSLLDEIEALAAAEIENTKAAIPAVDLDSRLGWECSMEYVCDRWHLEWKLRQMESALREVAAYRSIVEEAHRK